MSQNAQNLTLQIEDTEQLVEDLKTEVSTGSRMLKDLIDVELAASMSRHGSTRELFPAEAHRVALASASQEFEISLSEYTLALDKLNSLCRLRYDQERAELDLEAKVA